MEYKTARAKAKKYYRTIGAIFSPALDEQVYFSKHGFGHIRFKRGHRGRARKIQIRRFSLLPLAVNLVAVSTTYQEFEITPNRFRYWGLIAIIGNEKFKVVIRKIGQRGRAHFWSVIPDYWTSRLHDRALLNKNTEIKNTA